MPYPAGMDEAMDFEVEDVEEDMNPSMCTSWKMRGNKATKRMIDYILHNPSIKTGIECSHKLIIPADEEMEEHF